MRDGGQSSCYAPGRSRPYLRPDHRANHQVPERRNLLPHLPEYARSSPSSTPHPVETAFGQFGRCWDALGPHSAQVRAGQPSGVAKPLTGFHQGTVHPLVSGSSPGGPTKRSKGLGFSRREVKGLESLGVGHRYSPGLAGKTCLRPTAPDVLSGRFCSQSADPQPN